MADSTTVARPYARAVFDIALAQGNLAGWSQALGCAADVMRDEDAKRFLAGPSLSDEARASFVESIARAAGGGAVLDTKEHKNFLRLLAENDRLEALPEISQRFDELKRRQENKVKVKVTAASDVDKAIAEQIASSLRQKLGREVELEVETDPSLLGGAIIRAEDLVIDGSVRSRLHRLAEELVA